MRHLILVFLVIGSVMIFFSCQEESAFTPELSQSEQIPVSLAKPSPNLTGTLAKPSPNLIGTTDTPFYPLNGPFYWDGTINFEGYGDFDGEYGLIFRSHGPPRDFSQASTF